MPHTVPVVFVVDDDISVRESLDSLIRFAGWRSETFASAEEFLAHSRGQRPSCLILDVSLPDLNGLDLQTRIGAGQLNMPIIFITGHGDIPMTVRAMKAGAAEFLTKPFDDEALLGAIRQALGQSQKAMTSEDGLRAVRDRFESLTPREHQVMSLIVSGLLNKQVASQLGISEVTVKAHRGQVMRKMKVDSFAELVRLAHQLDLGSETAG